ncbi:glutamate/gamma-aminobutyrate family transporter YjeM [Clostridium sp. MT-14]|uniref:Glutamate/gamma-aminobutyrate family transporter YjeM n=1 Tax=Clostridium aromativorans TaxID=2836848 RepID=A0ABS8N6S1_9CLOT|nr:MULTISPECIES: glutamate/gamma-aminobutyrate family transporter YjeM [Clostridium]KAA8679102.1 glutamate/gamma-aminobutyrate family transporter YjeM [Clostridium sp. HV4-5-A1G]MCC9295381.1 glutamate/gamma-aminobutyrate family transporter YjeM [Clostridium aromativorans]
MSEKAKEANKKLTVIPLALMCVTSVFMFPNIPRAFLLMGYAAIPWYILAAITFLVPFAFMVAEYGAAFKKEKGGIYSWLEKVVGAKYAFISIFMWYVGWLVWITLTSNSIWVHFSTMLLGKDTTSNWSFLGLNATHTLGLLTIVFVFALTFTATKGLDKIIKITSLGGISVAFINIVAYIGAIIVFILNHGHLAQAINAQALVHSPNPGYQSVVSIISFISFAILAYAGIEVVAGVTDQTENAEKNFPKGVLIGAAFIAVCYALGIFAVGIFTSWTGVLGGKDVNMVNVTIIIMNNLGVEIGKGLSLSTAASISLGNWLGRFVGLSLFLTYLGALVSYSYSPIKQLVEGTPKELWPGNLSQIKDGLPKNAMWIQCIIIILFILFVSLGGQGASAFFDKLVLMTNVATTLPYIFIAGAFAKFKKNEEIEKPFVVYKNYKSSLIWTIIVTATVLIANVAVIIKPALTKGDFASSLWMIAGPAIFAVVALLMYGRYENIMKGKGNLPI